MTEDELETRFPVIPWREPIYISVPGRDVHRRLGCRFCIALLGLKAKDAGALSKTRAEFDAHMSSRHGRTKT